ncbi:MAG: DUF1080 domain-containing protein [Bacteroidota bacterium]
MKNISNLIISFLLIIIMSCSSGEEKSTNENETGTETEVLSEEWIVLFDGTSTEGWRGYNSDKLPEAWIIEDGTLKSLGKGGDIGGDIVYGEKEFEYFELYLEWKISEGGNSGIFYHVKEGEQYHAPYENAPEYQLIDDIKFPGNLEEWQKVGADYAMYPAPEDKPIKPAGEWNTTRIVYKKEKAEYYLNGVKVVEFVPWSEDWMERRNSGKWDKYPDYGKYKTGLIGLQDHGSFIWFRNIKIKEL